MSSIIFLIFVLSSIIFSSNPPFEGYEYKLSLKDSNLEIGMLKISPISGKATFNELTGSIHQSIHSIHPNGELDSIRFDINGFKAQIFTGILKKNQNSSGAMLGYGDIIFEKL